MKLPVPILLLLTLAFASGACRRANGAGDAATTGAGPDTAATLPLAPAIDPPLPDSALPSADAVKWNVVVLDTVTAPEVYPGADLYGRAPGVMMFRGGPLRDADFGATVSGTPSEIVVDWVFTTGSDDRETRYGTWRGGTGWTGQPLYVEWPGDVARRFPGHGRPDTIRREIIVGSLASEIYFIDFETGLATRPPLATGNPVKGTLSLDPTLNGNLYAGQGVPAEKPFGALTYNLFAHRLTHSFPEDPRAPRRWGAYDSSPVRVGAFLFRPGENGIIYKWHIGADTVPRLHSYMHYRAGGAAPGMESSMAVYRNYGYVADNHGHLLCVNLNTLRPMWLYNMGDDTDATPVIAIEEGHPYLYVGAEIDRQGEGTARFVKLDALTGRPVWERRIEGKRLDIDGKHFDGGFYGSPLLGRGQSSGIVMANCVLNLDGRDGKLMAFDRATGRTVWATPLRYYSWTSPVGFLNGEGRMFVLNADCAGNLYIIDAADGRVITRKSVGSNFESSAVAVGSSAVIGSRGNKIYKVTLK